MIFQPAGNYYDKYRTRNPIAKIMMKGFIEAFDDLLERCSNVDNALEVGCGEGELTVRLARKCARVSAFDVAPSIIEEARLRLAAANVQANLRTDDIYNLDPSRDSADLVVCCEVMEHLEDTADALTKLHDVCKRYLVVSVPREPLWRILNVARGRYLRELGNTPGHVQHWSRSEFLRTLQTRFKIIATRSPVPWTMALCEPK